MLEAGLINELNTAIKRTRCGKATGTENVAIEFRKSVINDTYKRLTEIVNQLLE